MERYSSLRRPHSSQETRVDEIHRSEADRQRVWLRVRVCESKNEYEVTKYEFVQFVRVERTRANGKYEIHDTDDKKIKMRCAFARDGATKEEKTREKTEKEKMNSDMRTKDKHIGPLRAEVKGIDQVRLCNNLYGAHTHAHTQADAVCVRLYAFLFRFSLLLFCVTVRFTAKHWMRNTAKLRERESECVQAVLTTLTVSTFWVVYVSCG